MTPAAGQVWTPTRPGSRAKARTIVRTAGIRVLLRMARDGTGGAITFRSRTDFLAWIARHTATCTQETT